MWTHKTGVVSSIPPCVTFETPLARKATGNHLMNSTSVEKTQSPVSGFCYARNRVCDAVNLNKTHRYTLAFILSSSPKTSEIYSNAISLFSLTLVRPCPKHASLESLFPRPTTALFKRSQHVSIVLFYDPTGIQ